MVSWTDAEGPEAAARALGGLIRERARAGAPRVAAEHFTLRLFERGLLLGGLPGTEFEPAEGFLDRLRMVKDPEDVEAMRQACRIAEEALERVMGAFRRGMTEKEIASALKIEMLRLGTEGRCPRSRSSPRAPLRLPPHEDLRPAGEHGGRPDDRHGRPLSRLLQRYHPHVLRGSRPRNSSRSTSWSWR